MPKKKLNIENLTKLYQVCAINYTNTSYFMHMSTELHAKIFMLFHPAIYSTKVNPAQPEEFVVDSRAIHAHMNNFVMI